MADESKEGRSGEVEGGNTNDLHPCLGTAVLWTGGQKADLGHTDPPWPKIMSRRCIQDDSPVSVAEADAAGGISAVAGTVSPDWR